MARTQPRQVKSEHDNIFLDFNLDQVIELAKQKKCPVCQKHYSRLHPIRKPNKKYYVYADHEGKSLHYVAPLNSYTYVINNLKATYYLYKSGMFDKKQLIDVIYFVFELITSESKEDPEFRKIIANSLKQLLEIVSNEQKK